jgi:hypothetical protein
MDYKIDLKAVLGSMFYKYDKFRIEFNSFDGWCNFPNWTNLPNNAVWKLGISGLNFTNNTNNFISDSMAFFPIRFGMPTNGYLYVNNSFNANGIVFEKPSNGKATITLSIYNCRFNAVVAGIYTTSNNTLNAEFSFTIYGLYDD